MVFPAGVFLVLVLLVHHGEGYSTGAVMTPQMMMEAGSLCSDVRPGHGNLPQSTPAPYTIHVQASVPYSPNRTVEVTIRGRNPADTIAGFFLTTTTTGGTTLGGSRKDWKAEAGKSKYTNYCGRHGLTHVRKLGAREVKLKWALHGSESYGDVQFLAIIVKNKNTFWTHVRSNPISPQGNMMTEAQKVKADMTRQYRAFLSTDAAKQIQSMMQNMRGGNNPGMNPNNGGGGFNMDFSSFGGSSGGGAGGFQLPGLPSFGLLQSSGGGGAAPPLPPTSGFGGFFQGGQHG